MAEKSNEPLAEPTFNQSVEDSLDKIDQIFGGEFNTQMSFSLDINKIEYKTTIVRIGDLVKINHRRIIIDIDPKSENNPAGYGLLEYKNEKGKNTMISFDGHIPENLSPLSGEKLFESILASAVEVSNNHFKK